MYCRPHTPMDFLGNHYYNLKNGIIKAERLLLKELGFCVHVKHPHKIIITYLQMLDHEKNVALTRKAWNYMNDSLRTDVFVRFSPETIACACIFLAARTVKVNLPLRPPWWELFDATHDEIEDISLTILRMYSRPRRKITHLEAMVNKIKHDIKKKKEKEEKEKDEKNTPTRNGSFTPSHVTSTAQSNAVTALNNNNSSKPSSRTNTPEEKSTEKRTVLSSVVATRKSDNNDKKHERRRRAKSESDETSEYSSDSGAELPSKKYAQQRRQYESKKRSPSTGSENERRTKPPKIRRSLSPEYDNRKGRGDKRDRHSKETNGLSKNYDSKSKRRSRSRSPVKRQRSVSPIRKDKYSKEKYRSKESGRYDKYSSKIRR